jgi:dipeptidyl aminopeptidase/acylaminoacyl peptidase
MTRPVVTPKREQETAKRLAEAAKDLTPREQVYLTIDPLSYASQVRCPSLIVQGGTDADIPVRSAERLAAAMRNAGQRDVTVRIFPGVSHSLLPDPIGLASGWAYLPGLITAPALLDEVTR